MGRLLNKTDQITRLAMFIVYFWFGLLKVIGQSPAYEIVVDLQAKMLPFIDSDMFFIGLGIFEVFLGVAFLVPKFTKWAFWLFLAHMFTTFGPLVFLPHASWQSFGALTLKGQYIVKNLVLVALGLSIYKDFSITNSVPKP